MKFDLLYAVLTPLLTRVGTAVSTVLVTVGATQTQVDNIQLGVIAVIGLGIDMITRKLIK